MMLGANPAQNRIVDLVPETLENTAIDLHLEALKLLAVDLSRNNRSAHSILDARSSLDIREMSPTETQMSEGSDLRKTPE
jgi:hypothetical protein